MRKVNKELKEEYGTYTKFLLDPSRLIPLIFLVGLFLYSVFYVGFPLAWLLSIPVIGLLLGFTLNWFDVWH